MFVPRSVIRRPKRSHATHFNSKDAARETLVQTIAVSHESKDDPSSYSDISSGYQTVSSNSQQSTAKLPIQDESSNPLDQSVSGSHESDDGDSEGSEDEPVLSFSKQQRWPAPEEPVCVVCGRYGAYIVDRTDDDVCSLECKAKCLMKLGIHVTLDTEGGADTGKAEEGDESWLYREHPEVTAMTAEQCSALYRKHDVKVKGERIPRPVTTFGHLSLPYQVGLNLAEAGFDSLTPVQMFIIPMVLMMRDILVCAPTGSGKTLSFLLPLITLLVRRTKPSERSSPRVLVLAPTRELAMQIEDQAKQLMKSIPSMKTALLVGGLPVAQQLHRLKANIQMIIATPARLNDIIDNHPSDIDLADVEVLVLDEVDCLLQMGFEPQVRQIESFLLEKRQNLMFSATIPPQVERMAIQLMKEPLYTVLGKPSAPCELVKHTVLWVEEASKRKKLIAFLKDPKQIRLPVVIFVSSKMGTLLLAEAINKLCPQVSAAGIHGDMAQERRSAVVQGLLDGHYSVVVTTNVLGRGMDLSNVRQVFIFDMPSSLLEFIHQVGRAGHLGSPGRAVSFINNECKSIFADFVDLLDPLGVHLPVQLTHSPHLTFQREQRKRTAASVKTAKAEGGYPPSKKRKKRDTDFHNRESLMDLIKSVRCQSD